MRKISIVAVTFVLVFSLVSIYSPVDLEQVSAKNNLQGITVLDLDPRGEKLKKVKERRGSKLNLEETYIDDNSVLLIGDLVIQNESIPFKLEGRLFKGISRDSKVVGELRDKLGNFEIIHFSIDSKSDESFMFTNANNNKGNLVKLYLLNTSNRDFSYFELDSPEFLAGTPFDSDISVSSLEKAPLEEEHWYAKLLDPVETKSYDDPSFDISTTQTINRTRIYSMTYDVVGGEATEYIRVGHYLAYDDRPSGSFDWNTKLYIHSKWTSSDVSDWNSDDSNMRIGYYHPSKIKAVTDEGDFINSHTWSYNTKNDSNLNIKISWNLDSIDVGPLTFSASYSNEKTSFKGYSYVHDHDPPKYVRDVEQVFDDGYLDSTDHGLMAIFNIGDEGSSGPQQIQVRYIYDVSNIRDFYWGDLQQYTYDQFYYSR